MPKSCVLRQGSHGQTADAEPRAHVRCQKEVTTMASTTSPTATLCHWVCSTRYGDLPAEVRQETVTLLYDQVGWMLASATLPSCQPVVALVRRLSPPGACSIVGHPVRTSVTQAALANGTIGHGDEVDSTGQH